MQRKLIPVKDYPDLMRDEQTGMIVNINKSKHRQRQLAIEHQRKKNEEIDQLKDDVNEIKQMLQKLLESGTNAQ
jgi:hypothetical protein